MLPDELLSPDTPRSAAPVLLARHAQLSPSPFPLAPAPCPHLQFSCLPTSVMWNPEPSCSEHPSFRPQLVFVSCFAARRITSLRSQAEVPGSFERTLSTQHCSLLLSSGCNTLCCPSDLTFFVFTSPVPSPTLSPPELTMRAPLGAPHTLLAVRQSSPGRHAAEREGHRIAVKFCLSATVIAKQTL